MNGPNTRPQLQSWVVPPTQIDSSSDEEDTTKKVPLDNPKEQAKVPNETDAANIAQPQNLWPSTTSLLVLAVAYILVTISFRDLLFLLVGIILTGAAVFHLTAKKWEKTHTKSRIVVHWEDLKYNFAAVMEKTDTIHSNKGYFINSFNQGLYQHATFDEQINVLEWVEKTEKRLQSESLAQFDRFLKRNSPEGDKSVLVGNTAQDALKVPDPKSKKTGEASKMAVQISLRDTSGMFSQLDGLLLKNLEDKSMKDLLSDMKSIISDLNKTVEEGLTLWSELDNQTLHKLRKIFTQEPTKNPLALFGWTEETIRQNAPNLLVTGSALRKYLDFILAQKQTNTGSQDSNRKSSDPLTVKSACHIHLLNTDWTEFRKRLDTLENLQIGMGQGIADTIQRLSKLSDDCQKHIQEGAENIKKLKDYFGEARAKLGELEKEFSAKIFVVKGKIKEYREAVDRLNDSEVLLRLEYEVRLEIQRLYSIKHAHEVEASGLERRLAEIEAFNASTVEIENTLYNQILEFAESSEDSLLPQVSNCLLTRLQSLFGENQDFPALENPRLALSIEDTTISISTGEDSFKKLLQDQLVEETLQPGEGISDWGECRKITEFLHELKRRVFKAREDTKDLNLDAAHEMEEGIIVNRLSESRMPQASVSMRDSVLGASVIGNPDGSITGSFVGTSNDLSSPSKNTSIGLEAQPKIDWTNNKPKLRMLQESIAKDKRVMEQCLSIVQEQITSVSKIEARIIKLHRVIQSTGKSKEGQTIGFKRRVFCRFGWWCLGRRVNLKVQSRSLGLLNDALNFIEKELENLYERAYKDESVEKLMGSKAKKNIFGMLNTVMWAEASLRMLCQQTILTSSFRDYFMTCYLKLMAKTSTLEKRHLTVSSVEDAKARQKHIRTGDHYVTNESGDPSLISPKPKSATLLEIPEDKLISKGKMSIDDFQLENGNSPLTPSRVPKASSKTPERGSAQLAQQSPISEFPKEESPELIKLDVLNKIFSTCFKEWAVNSYFERYVSKKLKKQLNKDRLSCFEEFAITSFKMDSKPMKLNSIQPQPSESFEFLADIDGEYDGLVSINIESTLIVNLTVKEYKLKVNIQVKIFQIYGVIRVCLVPLKYGKSW